MGCGPPSGTFSTNVRAGTVGGVKIPSRPKEARMSVEYRPRDPIPPGDDVVLRAGSGAVDILVQRAIVNAPDYEQLLRDGHVRSIFTMSVHVPRGDLPAAEDLLADPFYLRYRAYLEAPSAGLVDLAFVEIVATTPVTAGGMPSALDLCHYDIVIEADGEQQLRERIEIVVGRFTRHAR